MKITTASAGVLHSAAYRAYRQFMGRILQPRGISLTGWAVLGFIAESSGTRPSLIANELNIKRPLVAELLRGFESSGLITLHPDWTDARSKKVFLTPAGQQFVEGLENQLQTELYGFLDDVPVEDLTIYLRVLRKLANKLDRE